MYFDKWNCTQWQSECKSCPDNRALLKNQANRNFNIKKEKLSGIQNLNFVSVSDWLATILRQSVQKDRGIITIHNGTDISLFSPSNIKSPIGLFNILGVAAVWDERKGLNDFVKLRQILPDNFTITLVGLTSKQIKRLPSGISGLSKTSNVQELIYLYSNADVFVNPTYSDNFPTTNIEALACGTPVITYNTGGSPEAVDEKTGIVIEQGNILDLANAIKRLRLNPLKSEDCRKRAEIAFNKDIQFEKYIELYKNLLKL